MSKKVSGVIRFAQHDDLVVTYQSSLSRGAAQLRTARQLSAGDKVLLCLELTTEALNLELVTSVVESAPIEGKPGRFSTRVDLDEDAVKQIEQFIVDTDPALREIRASLRANAPKLKILIVDDSPAQAKIASEPFLERGDEVFLAEDGLVGLAMALKNVPDIILSDVQMPKADGWQLLRMIRARKQLARTPVIFLTTLGGEEDRLKGYRLGVDDYLQKPYSQEVLLARVERLLQRTAPTTSNSWIPRAPDGLRGDLEQVGLPALLSFLEMERKSGVIYLEPRGSLVMLENGRPVRAKTMDRDSAVDKQDVLYDLLGLASGRFEFVPGEVTEEDSIQTPLSALLMEHARQLDEGARRPA